jgi:ABC-2 type transport system ATP-binding protein
MTLPLVYAERLNKSFGANHAVHDLSLEIDAGQIYGLVGSDGAGKTTTLRLLAGALTMDSGEASICGFSIGKQTEQARAQLGYLSQRFSLYEDLTVLENIRFFAEVRGLNANDWLPRSMEILDFVGLANFKDRHAGQLSGGMKQKLGLATALVSRPKVLLLDEPTTGVDPVTRQDFWQLIIRLADKENLSVLVSTPYMDEAARCHRIGFVRAGQIITSGTPSEIRSILNDQVIEMRGSDLQALRHLAKQNPGVQDERAFGDRLHLRIAKGQSKDVIRDLAAQAKNANVPVDDLRAVPPTLEDVFIALSDADWKGHDHD